MPKALVLFSGGLDSLLAARMMQGQPGLEVEGIHFSSLFTSRHDADDGEHPAFEGDLIATLQKGPCPVERVHSIMRYPGLYSRYLDQLESQGSIVRSGLTPTDAAHVLGQYSAWDEQAARLVAELISRRMGIEAESLCQQIVALTSARAAAAIIAKLVSDEGWNGHHDVLESHLVERALRLVPPAAHLDCRLTVRPPIVAIGAPVQTYFPRVSQLLNGTLHIPDHSEVANALGAVAGSVVHRTHVLILPQADDETFRVHLPDDVQDFGDLGEAVAHAEARGRALAIEGARRAGAEDIRVQVDRRDKTAPVAQKWGESIYLQTDMDVTAVGRPRLAHR